MEAEYWTLWQEKNLPNQVEYHKLPKTRLQMEKIAYLWFDASPYKGIGYNTGLAEGGHKTTEHHKILDQK